MGNALPAPVGLTQGCSQSFDAATDGANDTLAHDALIDDFEHKDGSIYPRAGRHGAWVTFNDGTGTQTPASGALVVPELRAGDGGAGSHMLHTFGTSFATWGAAVQASLSSTPYNAQGYSGIRFTYASSTPLTFGIATVATTPPPQGSCASDCYGHFGTRLQPSPDLTTVEVSWDQVYQSFGAPAVFDPTQLLALQWNIPAGVPFDVWLDDIMFVPACSEDGGPVSTRPPPPSILVDDFEDGDPLPSDRRFQGWQHWAYNGGGPTSDHPLAPGETGVYSFVGLNGDASNRGMELEWLLQDPPDGQPNFPGGGVRTLMAPYLDLSRYSRLVFSHRFEHAADGCEWITYFRPSIGCGEKHTSFQIHVPVSSQWTEATIPFESFREYEYAAPTNTPIADCLAVADALWFEVQSPGTDGACGSGHLFLDSISIR